MEKRDSAIKGISFERVLKFKVIILSKFSTPLL